MYCRDMYLYAIDAISISNYNNYNSFSNLYKMFHLCIVLNYGSSNSITNTLDVLYSCFPSCMAPSQREKSVFYKTKIFYFYSKFKIPTRVKN